MFSVPVFLKALFLVTISVTAALAVLGAMQHKWLPFRILCVLAAIVSVAAIAGFVAGM